jgi:hypothetical protein
MYLDADKELDRKTLREKDVWNTILTIKRVTDRPAGGTSEVGGGGCLSAHAAQSTPRIS